MKRLLKVVGTKKVPISSVCSSYDVRVVAGAADAERVEYFEACYAEGIKLPNIEVAEVAVNSYELTDGRTRLASLKKSGERFVVVDILERATEAEYRMHAYLRNCTGAKVPDLQDLKATVEGLFLKGMKTEEIMRDLSGAETGARLRRATAQVWSNMQKRAVARAKKYVSEQENTPPNISIPDAAKRFGVTAAAIRKALYDEKATRKKNTLLNEIRKDLGKHYNRDAAWRRAQVRRLDERFQEDAATPGDILDVYDYVLKNEKSAIKMLEEARVRFEKRVAELEV